jgi:hypothetical protein
MPFLVLVDWKQTIRRKIAKFAVLLLVSSIALTATASRESHSCAKPFSVFVPRPQLQRQSSNQPHHLVRRQHKQAWPDQEIIRRQALL